MSSSFAGAEMMTLRAPASRCLLALAPIREPAGGLDHGLHPEGLPGQRGGVFGRQDLDLLPVHDQAFLFGLDRPLERPVNRIVFQ